MANKDDAAKLPVPVSIARPVGTKATNDEELVASWVANLNSEHSRRNFELTPRRFLDELEAQALALRTATVEDVRDAINAIAAGQTLTSARQTMLRVKSLLSYGHRLGYLQFNAGERSSPRGWISPPGAGHQLRSAARPAARMLSRQLHQN